MPADVNARTACVVGIDFGTLSARALVVRAGGGEELGGLVGVKLYLQRVAVQGTKTLVDGLVGEP